jgi:murein L,D-transpeptidase YcbB/YkuD
MKRLWAFRYSACIALVLAALTTACASKIDNSQHTAAIRETLEATPRWVDRTRLGRQLWEAERQFYEARGYTPAWVDGDGTTPQWKDLIQQLHYSERHGLDPASYGPQEFEQLRDASQTRTRGTRFPLDRIPEMDAKMTYAYLRYAADLLGWTHSAKDVHKNWLTSPKKEDLAARLDDAVKNNRVRDSLEELAPTHPQYKGLQAALMRERQAPTGHLDQIRMNLERWRWAPRDLGERYILINVPAYQLQVMEGNEPKLAMRVIVGQPDHQTPLFSDEMTYMVFSPYWNIPPDILRDETLPRVARDPDYLRRNNMEVVGTSGEVVDASGVDWSDEGATRGLRFRQAPGPENALGLVKFIFPNHFNVYLHDTPGDRLFFKDVRALSHGCIRVEQPVALAQYVLADQPQWTAERIRTAMNANSERTVKLKETLPVHIGYWTAWVEPDGKTVTYTADPYNIDPAHARLLPPMTPRQAPAPATAE